MTYIDKEILISEIRKIQPAYDDHLREYLMRHDVLKVIQEQPVIEMEKCCSTCAAWDRETNRNNKCFCEFIEANTTGDFRCRYWEEDKNYGCRP